MRNIFAAVAVVLAMTASVQAQPAPSPEIAAFLARFVEDFDNTDWPRFRTLFTDDSTVFFPQQYGAERATGRAETDAAWQRVFGAIRTASGKTAPPYMHLEPRDLLVQQSGDSAIVTFTLAPRQPGGPLNRRTLVLVKSADGWKIAHLHGSTAP